MDAWGERRKEKREEVFLAERCDVTCGIIDRHRLIGNLPWPGIEGTQNPYTPGDSCRFYDINIWHTSFGFTAGINVSDRPARASWITGNAIRPGIDRCWIRKRSRGPATPIHMHHFRHSKTVFNHCHPKHVPAIYGHTWWFTDAQSPLHVKDSPDKYAITVPEKLRSAMTCSRVFYEL